MMRTWLAVLRVFLVAALFASSAASEQPTLQSDSGPTNKPQKPDQSELEAAFGKMLSGATLEGSFTSTGEHFDPAKLAREKYTLGNVKKLEGDYWLIPARIQYGDHDITIPLMLPVRWAGDTPMIVVDEVSLPGFGTVSARVMFFADHYAGYWKHGKNGGHLFGIISRDAKSADALKDTKSNAD